MDFRYEQLVASGSTTQHRFVTIQVNAHEKVTKDPIYLALRGSSGSDGSQFLTLLHEIPLYLEGRSLRQENAELYRKAHALYRTRNCLAHTGELNPNKEGLLEVTREGAVDGIRTMNGVMEWFGESGTSVPTFDMVEFDGSNDK